MKNYIVILIMAFALSGCIKNIDYKNTNFIGKTYAVHIGSAPILRIKSFGNMLMSYGSIGDHWASFYTDEEEKFANEVTNSDPTKRFENDFSKIIEKELKITRNKTKPNYVLTFIPELFIETQNSLNLINYNVAYSIRMIFQQSGSDAKTYLTCSSISDNTYKYKELIKNNSALAIKILHEELYPKCLKKLKHDFIEKLNK